MIEPHNDLDRWLPFPCMDSKWSGPVLAALEGRVLRFTEIRRGLPGISPKTLSAILRQFDRDGLVERRQFAVIPPRVEYGLTQVGESLVKLLSLVKDLAERSRPQIQASQVRFAETRLRHASHHGIERVCSRATEYTHPTDHHSW